MRPSFVSLLTALVHLTVVSAELTSLYVPGFDPQPLSAEVAGVDEGGSTTWIVHAGQPTGTFTEVDFIGTATLVEGADGASLTFAGPFDVTLGFDCAFSDGVAICSDETDTETETISSFAVQLGSASAPAGTPAPTPDAPNASDPSQSAPSGSPSRTATSDGGSPSETASDNSSGHVILPSIAIAIGSAIMSIVMA